jgi:hypothetical protein
MISDDVDLNVQSGNKGTKMRFLITDLGLEDLSLGYPWLAYFEQKFSWKEGVIDIVTDLQGPPSERTPEQKLWDFKTRAQQYARDRESCDDVRISYLEFLETEAEDDLALARMIAG